MSAVGTVPRRKEAPRNIATQRSLLLRGADDNELVVWPMAVATEPVTLALGGHLAEIRDVARNHFEDERLDANGHGRAKWPNIGLVCKILTITAL